MPETQTIDVPLSRVCFAGGGQRAAVCRRIKIHDTMKKFVKAVLRKFGVILLKRSSGVYLPEGESYRIVCGLCGRQDPVIIDGGAHRGGSVAAFSSLAPEAQFHCFEPDPVLADSLRTIFAGKGNVKVVQAALGESRGCSNFNINASRPTNSLLQMAEGLQPNLRDLCQAVAQIEVEVTTLDAYCRENGLGRVDIVKLDLQGYDYMALRGARSVLRETSVVMVEVLFVEIYKGCRLFPDILGLMHELGFDLYTLCGLQYGEESKLLWADAIFIKKGRREDGETNNRIALPA